nr:MAG TPA: hypothetical protein [Caudoviricetes sp.]
MFTISKGINIIYEVARLQSPVLSSNGQGFKPSC